MGNEVVSIVSPCYNGEHYVSNFLDSVLAQDYPAVELIMIDDGSTDDTRGVITGYHDRFTQRGYQLHYIYQEHAGQSEAINKGLQRFTGDYLTWFDSDDLLTPDSLSRRVTFLKEHPEYGFCCCNVAFVDEHDFDHVIFAWGNLPVATREEFFENIMFCRHALFPDGYLVPSGNFLKLFPERHIYPSPEGQNWQLILPLAYHLDCGFMPECLAKVVERTGSHSRMERTPRDWIERYAGQAEVLLNVLAGIKPRKLEQYEQTIKRYYTRQQLHMAPRTHDSALGQKIYAQLCQLQEPGLHDRLAYAATRQQAVYALYTVASGIWRAARYGKQLIGKVLRLLKLRR
ncbi:MAG TPA: hypothetical protein DEA67_04350 [Selenomonas sp.]|nr:hypothetical protein [Selenomonas sp.]